MDPTLLSRYISNLQEGYRKKPELDFMTMNIIEQFAWDKCRSAYEIYTKLNSPSDRYYRKMAYKNVNKRIHELFSLGLIEETMPDKKLNKRKAVYYRLTEYGVYRLFLNRLSSVVVNQFNFRRTQETSINMLTFFHNYQNSTIFKLFIYPYFEEKTLFAIWNFLLFDLYSYLNECCRRIEPKLKQSIIPIPIGETAFSLEKDSEQDDYKSLLLYLKDKFNVSDTLLPEKNADKAIITIYAILTQITIDKNKKEVTIISTANDRYEEFKYGLYPLGSKIFAMEKRTSKEYLNDISDNLRNDMDEIIYRLVCIIANKDHTRNAEFLYYSRVLFEDKKFMKTVERIYCSQHTSFEQGYKILRNI